MVTIQQTEEISRWFLSQGQGSAVVVLIHGLNQRPSSWQDLIAELVGRNMHVYRLSLTGHQGRSIQHMHAVSAEIWLDDFHQGYEEATLKFPGLPVYLVANSMGALLASVAQLKLAKSLFSKQFMLAPALSLKLYTRIALPLAGLLPSLPSRAPKEYRANLEGTTRTAYLALFRLDNMWRTHREKSVINVPTCIVMRKRDELVSYSGLKRLLSASHLNNWQVQPIRAEQKRLYDSSFQHLIVDRKSVGSEMWDYMMHVLESFLLEAR